MKRTNQIVTLILTGMLTMTAHAADGFIVPNSVAASAGQPIIRLARLTEEEKNFLRKKWQNLPPEMRGEVRRQLREESRDHEEGYGQGYENRRRDNEDERDTGFGQGYDPRRWIKPRR